MMLLKLEAVLMGHRCLTICCAVSLLFLQACSLQKSQLEQKERSASELISIEDLDAYFSEYTNATVLLSDDVSRIVYNESFSTQRRSPNSTFKIINSLIALEEGVVKIDDSIRPWDGAQYSRSELNQDQDMASSIKYSCVWYYKQLAREIGKNAMQNHLNNVGYGNMDISGGIDQFWLNSSLLISAQEQFDLIIRLYRNELPFSQDNMEYVKSIMHQKGYPFHLYGKTGSSGEGDGWFVGYALLNEKPYFFATYIEGKDASSSLARDKTTRILGSLLNR